MTTTADAPLEADVTQPTDLDDFDVFDPELVGDGEDYIQSGIAPSGEGDFEYPLTSFVPKCSPMADKRSIPSEAAVWIIPDLDNRVVVRGVKIFKTTFQDKVLPGYNMLFVRVDRRTDQPNPTKLQEAILRTVVAKFPGPDGLPRIPQIALVPILRLREGRWLPSIGELNMTALAAAEKANADAEDMSDGMLSLKTRPIALWRPADDNKVVNARIVKRLEEDYDELVASFADRMIDVPDYIKKRGIATEKYWAQQWRNHAQGLTGGSADSAATPEEQFVDAAMNLSTAQLRTILIDADIPLGTSKTKQALLTLATENMARVSAEVLKLAAMMTAGDDDSASVPF